MERISFSTRKESAFIYFKRSGNQSFESGHGSVYNCFVTFSTKGMDCQEWMFTILHPLNALISGQNFDVK